LYINQFQESNHDNHYGTVPEHIISHTLLAMCPSTYFR